MERDTGRRAHALRLLETLYDVALGGADWSTFMRDLTTTMEGDVGVLAVVDTIANRPEFVAQVGITETMQAQYAERFCAIDPWPVVFEASGMPLGRNGCSQDFLSMRDFARTEYYNEFWRPNGDLFHTCGGFFAIDEGHVGLLAAPRARRRRAYTAEHAAVLDLITPHLGKALRLQQRLTKAEKQCRDLTSAFDCIGDAIFILDSAGRILSTNHAGDVELILGSRLSCKTGRLVAKAAAANIQLQSFIASTSLQLESELSSATVATIVLEKRGIAPAVAISCYPLSSRYVETTGLASSATGLIVLSGAWEQPAKHLVRALRALFALTPTEALVAGALVRGAPLEEVASGLNMTMGTARTHLRHVFAKTETRRQAELVARVHRVLPLTFLQR